MADGRLVFGFAIMVQAEHDTSILSYRSVKAELGSNNRLTSSFQDVIIFVVPPCLKLLHHVLLNSAFTTLQSFGLCSLRSQHPQWLIQRFRHVMGQDSQVGSDQLLLLLLLLLLLVKDGIGYTKTL